MPPTVALTGATGFIGSALARSLGEHGWHVRALVRPTADLSRLPAPSVERVTGSLDEPESLRRLVGGATAVIHCAGTVRGARRGHFEAANVRGVGQLASRTATEAPGACFVLVSSLAARHPQLSWYAASKRAGEEVLAAAGTALCWTVLRPPAVYGTGDREIQPLLRWMARGIAPVLGPRDARFSLVHVDDLADAVRHLLMRGPRGGETFEIHDGRHGGYAWRDVVGAVERVSGRPVLPVRVPTSALRLAGGLALASAWLVARRPMLTPGKVREITHGDWICDNEAFTEATGWRPRVDLIEGLRRTLRGHGERASQHAAVRGRPGHDERGAGAIHEGQDADGGHRVDDGPRAGLDGRHGTAARG